MRAVDDYAPGDSRDDITYSRDEVRQEFGKQLPRLVAIVDELLEAMPGALLGSGPHIPDIIGVPADDLLMLFALALGDDVVKRVATASAACVASEEAATDAIHEIISDPSIISTAFGVTRVPAEAAGAIIAGARRKAQREQMLDEYSSLFEDGSLGFSGDASDDVEATIYNEQRVQLEDESALAADALLARDAAVDEEAADADAGDRE